MQFDTAANFTHQFFLPFGITFAYVNMDLYITGESLDPDAGAS
jgi:hypothetical protein